jgi:hypothetical protein
MEHLTISSCRAAESSAVKFPPSSKADGGSEERVMPTATKKPLKSMKIPIMILRIAIIVTSVGRDLYVPCKLLYIPE